MHPRASGDADLPSRDTLNDRAARLRSRSSSAAAAFGPGGEGGGGGAEEEEEGGGGGGGRRSARVPLEEEDGLYQAAAAAAARKRADKAAAYPRPQGRVAEAEPEAEGRRGVTRAIEKNRGLTPHRNKLAHNPRAKLRHKFAKANVRRSGAVRTAGAGDGAHYGGEASGIKANVSRSRRL